MNTKVIINELKKLEDTFDFRNLVENHEPFSNKNKNVIGLIEIGAPKNIIIEDFVCLRSKMYAFKCGIKSKNKLKGISKSYPKKYQIRRI